MANVRNLKKDVLYLTSDLNSIISVKVVVDGIDAPKAISFAEKVEEYCTSFVNKANHPGVDASDAKAVRNAYRQIRKDMIAEYEKLADEIAQGK